MLRNMLRFKRDQEGIALVEFALSIPLLLALLMGAIEVTRYILIEQKVEKVAVTISDVVAQGTTISNSQLGIIIDAASQVMLPYSFGSNGYVIITSVTQTGAPGVNNPPMVNWQYNGGGTLKPVPSSTIGTPNNAANLPVGFTMADKDNIIITEAFYNYTPLLANNGILNNNLIYKSAIYKPRLGTLSTLSWLCVNPVSRASGCTRSCENSKTNPAQSLCDSQDMIGATL